MLTCLECEAEFEVIHDTVSEPEFCPFCAAKLRYENDEEESEDWYPDP